MRCVGRKEVHITAMQKEGYKREVTLAIQHKYTTVTVIPRLLHLHTKHWNIIPFTVHCIIHGTSHFPPQHHHHQPLSCRGATKYNVLCLINVQCRTVRETIRHWILTPAISIISIDQITTYLVFKKVHSMLASELSTEIIMTILKNDKAKFKVALGKYLNTHTLLSVDEFCMCKDDP